MHMYQLVYLIWSMFNPPHTPPPHPHPPKKKKMQTIFANAFSGIKSFVFWIKFLRISFLKVQLSVTQH